MSSLYILRALSTQKHNGVLSSSECQGKINIPLGCLVCTEFDFLKLNTRFAYLNPIQKKYQMYFGHQSGGKFPPISKMSLNSTPAIFNYLFIQFSELMIIKSKHQSTLTKMLQVLQYQMLSQDLVLYFEKNKHIHLLCKFVSILINSKIICIPKNCDKINFSDLLSVNV